MPVARQRRKAFQGRKFARNFLRALGCDENNGRDRNFRLQEVYLILSTEFLAKAKSGDGLSDSSPTKSLNRWPKR